jgi:predicted RNA-binding Zn-ribbon protein involved in translation (DUF1610 family)
MNKQFKQRFLQIILVAGLVIFLVSLWDILFMKGWSFGILLGYGIVLTIALVIRVFGWKLRGKNQQLVNNFERTLQGGLFHFQCPTCKGIFALKKSRSSGRRPFKMTCPDCGALGIIPSFPQKITKNIPEKKSRNIQVSCRQCGGSLMIWAEGTHLQFPLHLFSCPYCGATSTMENVM